MSAAAHRKTLSRRRSERAGRRAEWIVALILTLKGYRILARRFRVHSGEIDLIARRGDVIAFIEVKARAKLDDAIGAVSTRARRRIERAAEMFMAQRPHLADCAMRYDIVATAPWRFRHLPGAWRFGE